MAGLFVFILVHPLFAELAIGGTFLGLDVLASSACGRCTRAPFGMLLIVGILRRRPSTALRPTGWVNTGGWPATLPATATFTGAITARVADYVLDRHPITTDKVFGAVAAYVLIAFTFACVFALLQEVQPGAFHAAPVHAPNQLDSGRPRTGTSFTASTSPASARSPRSPGWRAP